MTILLADDNPTLCYAMRLFLEQALDVTVVGEVSHVQELLALLTCMKVDLILLDWDLPGQPTVDTITALHALTHQPQIIALSTRIEAEFDAVAAGVDSFISKSEPPSRLETIICSLHNQGI